jgi:hypothetical protein
MRHPRLALLSGLDELARLHEEGARCGVSVRIRARLYGNYGISR